MILLFLGMLFVVRIVVDIVVDSVVVFLADANFTSVFELSNATEKFIVYLFLSHKVSDSK